MPRKQRFKPSRKPKPDAQALGIPSEVQPTHVGTSHRDDGIRDSPHVPGGDSVAEPELSQRPS
jgi:hypothetical protein